MSRSMISIGGSRTLVPVVYRGPVELSLPTDRQQSCRDYGFLFISGQPEDLAILFGQISSADSILYHSDGRQVKFRLFGRNSYNEARDLALVVCIELIEMPADK